MYAAVPPVTAPIVAVPLLAPHDAFVVVVAKAVGPATLTITLLIVN